MQFGWLLQCINLRFQLLVISNLSPSVTVAHDEYLMKCYLYWMHAPCDSQLNCHLSCTCSKVLCPPACTCTWERGEKWSLSLSKMISPIDSNQWCYFLQSASVGGAAHLVNFQGTDTIASLIMARDYYGSSKIAGLSIPAAEHSTITSWTKDGETAAFRNMLTKVSYKVFFFFFCNFY